MHEPERMFDRHVLPRPPQCLLRLIEHAAIDRLARKLAARLAEALQCRCIVTADCQHAQVIHQDSFASRDCVRPEGEGPPFRAHGHHRPVVTLVGCVHSHEKVGLEAARRACRLAPFGGSGHGQARAGERSDGEDDAVEGFEPALIGAVHLQGRILGRAPVNADRQRTPHRIRQRGKPGGRGQRLLRHQADHQGPAITHSRMAEVWKLFRAGGGKRERPTPAFRLEAEVRILPLAVGPVIHGLPADAASPALEPRRLRPAIPHPMPVLQAQGLGRQKRSVFPKDNHNAANLPRLSPTHTEDFPVAFADGESKWRGVEGFPDLWRHGVHASDFRDSRCHASTHQYCQGKECRDGIHKLHD